MVDSEDNIRGQIYELEGHLKTTRSENTKGVHVKTNLEKNYADITLEIASCNNKMDLERFDLEVDPYDSDYENERMKIPNLSRFAMETESQSDLREFVDLQPRKSLSYQNDSYASLSSVCKLPNLSSDLSEDKDEETPIFNSNFLHRDEYIKTPEDQNAYSKPNFIDLHRRRSKTYATKAEEKPTGPTKRSYSLVDQCSPVLFTPQYDSTPRFEDAFLEDDESVFQPDGNKYEPTAESSSFTADLNGLSLGEDLVEPNFLPNDSDDSDDFDGFIKQRKEKFMTDAQDGRKSPYYQQAKPQHSHDYEPYSPLEPQPQQVIMRPRIPHEQNKRKTMPPQSADPYSVYPTHRPFTSNSKSRSNHPVPDPNLVLRPVHSARDSRQGYISKFRPRKTSNNTIAGYAPSSTQQLEGERWNYNNTYSTRVSYTRQHPENREGAQSAHPRYPVSRPHQAISPDAFYEDDPHAYSQPYETTINSNTIMNTQSRVEYPPQYQYTNPAPNRRQSTAYVSPHHVAAIPVNFPTYDTSPVDSGIYSLHNFATFRPQTVAGHHQHQQQEFDDDDRPDDSSPVDVRELVSELRKQITVLSSRIKRFEDRKPVSLEVTSPQPHIMSPILSPNTPRSPSVTSSGSEGTRKKRSPLRISPNMNHPHPPSSHSKSNLPPNFRPDGRSRARELGREERPILHTQFSAPSINRPLPISRARSGLSEETRNRPPPRASPAPTSSNILYPYTRHEASQNASNVTRARSSIGTASQSMLQMHKPTTRYRAAPPPVKPTTSVSPQPTPILRTPRYQYTTNANRASDGYSYDEDPLKKTSRLPRADSNKKDYY